MRSSSADKAHRDEAQGRAITRAEAKARGLKRYYTGVPCLHGHVCERSVHNCECLQCARLRHLRYRAENLETLRAKRRAWHHTHRERENEQHRRWLAKNQEHVSEYTRRYRITHKDRLREYDHRYQIEHRDQGAKTQRFYRANNPEGRREEIRRSGAIRAAQISHLEELGFFFPTDTYRKKERMLIDLKRLGVIKQEEWK